MGKPLSEGSVTFDEANKIHPWNEDLCKILGEVFLGLPAAEWEQRLVAKGVPCCRVADNSNEGFYLHSLALHLGLIDEAESLEYHNLRQAGVQIRFSETPAATRHRRLGSAV